jgi:hypothetical protein
MHCSNFSPFSLSSYVTMCKLLVLFIFQYSFLRNGGFITYPMNLLQKQVSQCSDHAYQCFWLSVNYGGHCSYCLRSYFPLPFLPQVHLCTRPTLIFLKHGSKHVVTEVQSMHWLPTVGCFARSLPTCHMYIFMPDSICPQAHWPAPKGQQDAGLGTTWASHDFFLNYMQHELL